MRNNPAKPIVDIIERLTTELGGVSNLHGNVFEASLPTSEVAGAKWYVVEGRGSIPRDILIDAAVNDRVYVEIPAIGGRTAFSELSRPSTSVLLYTGVLTPASASSGPSTVPIKITAPDATIGLFVDDVPVMKGVSQLNTEILIPTRSSTIQIVLERTILSNVVVDLPASVRFGHLPAAPESPSWDDPPITFDYYGVTEDSSGLRLRWMDSSYAGSWRIERTSYRLLGDISAVNYDTDAGVYEITVPGNHLGVSGDALVGPDVLLGKIIDTVANGGSTDIVVRSDIAQGSWVGLQLFVSDIQGVVAEVEREDVASPLEGVFSYLDIVKEGVPYTYRLIAVHPLHSNVQSAPTEKVSKFALDDTPPGNITIVDHVILGDLVTVNFTTPSDVDFAGVRVYYQQGGNALIAQHLSRPGTADQLTFKAPGTGNYHFRSFDWAGNTQAVGVGINITDLEDLDEFQLPPTITINVISVTNLSQVVEIVGSYDDPSKTLLLEWTFGPGAYDNSKSGTSTVAQQLTINRSNEMEDRILRVKLTVDGDSVETIYIVDWDYLPEVVVANLRPYYNVNNEVIGWTVFGTVDDDTRSIRLFNDGNSGDYTIEGSTTINTVSSKTFSVNIQQAIGKQGTLRIQPYSQENASGTLGKAYNIELVRVPTTDATFRDISLTRTSVTLTPNPISAYVHYMVYLDQPGDRANHLNDSTWISPANPGVQSFTVNRTDVPVIVEYYARVPGVAPEPSRFLRLDPDAEPQIMIMGATEGNANELVVDLDLSDSDIASYAVWTRPTSWPTISGAEDGPVLNDDYLRVFAPRPSNGIAQLRHYAATGTWRVIAIGYDYNGVAGTRATASATIAGSPGGSTGDGSLTNIYVTLVDGPDPLDPYKHHAIHWTADEIIQLNQNQYTVRVYEKLEVGGQYQEITPIPHPAAANGFTSPTQLYLVQNHGVYLTFYYRIDLYRNGNLIRQYTTSRSDSFDWGSLGL